MFNLTVPVQSVRYYIFEKMRRGLIDQWYHGGHWQNKSVIDHLTDSYQLDFLWQMYSIRATESFIPPHSSYFSPLLVYDSSTLGILPHKPRWHINSSILGILLHRPMWRINNSVLGILLHKPMWYTISSVLGILLYELTWHTNHELSIGIIFEIINNSVIQIIVSTSI